jgi:ParB family transcriptional regulator, chromosome partitioning protein
MESLRRNGLLQPIIVRIFKQRFQVVAGNRRLEACRRLHWIRIPCLVRDLDNKAAFEIGLTENIERKSLTPLEEARAFRKYVRENSWGSETALAIAIGRSKAYVSHRIRLLSLPDDVLELIESDKIDPSTAGELTPIDNPQAQTTLAKALSDKKISTLEAREAVAIYRSGLGINSLLNLFGVGEAVGASDNGLENEKNQRKYLHLLNKSILALKVCIVRLDSVIEELDSPGEMCNLKDLLIKRRLLIHNQIDDLLRLKRQGDKRSLLLA